MKIKIFQLDGRSKPLPCCDLCDEPLSKEENSNEYLIPDLPEGGVGEAIVGHKKCTRAYEKAHPDQEFGNMDVEALFVYMINGMRINLPEHQERITRLAGIGI